MSHRFAYVLLAILILAIMPASVKAEPLPPRHLTFHLLARTMTGEVIPIGEEAAADIECTSYKRTSPTSWQGSPAPVVYLWERWNVSILSTHDDMLYCSSGIVDFAPTWIEDHDPGLPGSNDMLIMNIVSGHVEEINREKSGASRPLGVNGCGIVPGTREPFCTSLLVNSDVFGVGDGGPRV